LMPISLSTRNILKNDNHYATYTVQMPSEGVRSPMSRGRVAFIGVGLLRCLRDVLMVEYHHTT
jgi:hypothetical protein